MSVLNPLKKHDTFLNVIFLLLAKLDTLPSSLQYTLSHDAH